MRNRVLLGKKTKHRNHSRACQLNVCVSVLVSTVEIEREQQKQGDAEPVYA